MFECRLGYDVIVTFHPNVFVVSNVGGVVADVESADVIDDRVQRVPAVAADAIVVSLGHERRHIEFGGKRYECGNFLIHRAGMLEAFQMKAYYNWQCSH